MKKIDAIEQRVPKIMISRRQESFPDAISGRKSAAADCRSLFCDIDRVVALSV